MCSLHIESRQAREAWSSSWCPPTHSLHPALCPVPAQQLSVLSQGLLRVVPELFQFLLVSLQELLFPLKPGLELSDLIKHQVQVCRRWLTFSRSLGERCFRDVWLDMSLMFIRLPSVLIMSVYCKEMGCW